MRKHALSTVSISKSSVDIETKAILLPLSVEVLMA